MNFIIKIKKKCVSGLFGFLNKKIIVCLSDKLVDLYKIFAHSLKKECINNKPVEKVLSINNFEKLNFNYNATLYTILMDD